MAVFRSLRRFAIHLFQELPRFRHDYNGALAEFRQVHKLRSGAQPLPDLHQEGEWLEAPFWIWDRANPARRPLYVRRAGKSLELTDRGELAIALDGENAERALAEWDRYAQRGIKIRSRALITTLYARLFLSDLFLHGIGGAKYDQVNDELARRFFGFAPPPYVTLSATLRLPIAHAVCTGEKLTAIDQKLRELSYHPEKSLLHNASLPGAAGAIESKRRWIETPRTYENAIERHRAIATANEALQPYVQADRERLLARQSQRAEELRASAILDSREYAFCLFPAAHLRKRLLDLSSANV